MQESNLLFPQEIYSAYLTILNGIKLSKREIDIISCILNGRSAKGIAHLLSIAPKTVEAHTYNVMKKLDCPSRESLISLVERSDRLLLLKRYYLRLLSHLAFEQTLKNISKLGSNEERSCVIVCWKEEAMIALLSQIKAHLELAGVKVSLEIRENGESSLHLISKKRSSYCTLYALSKEGVEGRENFSSFFKKLSSPSSQVLFLALDKETLSYISSSIDHNRYINFAGKEDYYFSVFTLLKRLFPQRNFDPLVEEFKKKHQFMTPSSEVSSPPHQSTSQKGLTFSHLTKSLKQGKWFLTALFLVCGGVLMYQGLKEKEPLQNHFQLSEIPIETEIRSDLNLPNERVLLKRPELMSQIDNELKNYSGIQTIALIGMGGAGKTTLARHYAHQQKANVIWEINAETHKSLQESFDHLAQALAKTEEDQKKLRELQGIKNSMEREERVVLFVKERLKNLSNWFLLYDNVEHIADIQNHFPQDVATWGQGKVILTTRNNHIQNNKHVNFSLFVVELNPEQKLDLFIHIMSNGNSSFLTPQEIEEAKAFLETIPSFPLDVSIAAYYLKVSNVSYDQYLKNLAKYNQNFETFQKDILKEAGDYTKTRYNIIVLSLQQLIASHKDFKDLLLFISLIDSQNIPRELLNSYKEQTTVDNFIHHLKKYSLITHESAPSSISTFSIHRSTQAISLNYFTSILGLEKNKNLTSLAVHVLKEYINKESDKKDFFEKKILVNHCEKCLGHKKLLSVLDEGILSGELGHLYYCLSDQKNAKKFLEKSFLLLNKEEKKYNNPLAKTLSYLGIFFWGIGEFNEAQKSLEEGLRIYKKYAKKDYEGLSLSYRYLGMLYTDQGHYEKAQEAYEESIKILKKYVPNNNLMLASALSNLGRVYLHLGGYKKAKTSIEESSAIYNKLFNRAHINMSDSLTALGYLYSCLGEFEKAKNLLEEVFTIYKENYPKDSRHMAWALRNLGTAYNELGNCQMAKKLLEQSFKTFKALLGNDNIKTKWTLSCLGEAYRDTGDTKKAKDAFKECLKAYETYYGKEHLQTALILRALGKTYLLEDNLEISEEFLQRALNIYQKKNHPHIYATLEDLSEVYGKKSKQAGNKQESQFFEKKAINCLKQALQIVKTHFPENSPHITRIQSKLENLIL